MAPSTGIANLFGTGRVVRNMGKSIVSSGSVYTKIQAVVPETAGPLTNGVTGPAASATNPGYATYYVETTANQATPNALVRYV